MNWAIMELYCGESGKLGYYNSQELGLARALALKNINVTIVYPDRNEKIRRLEEIEERICVLRVPCKAFGVHAFYNLDFLLEREIDVVHLDSDNQMFAPEVMKFCSKHHIFFYNYIGTIYSDTENILKKFIMKMVTFRNVRYFKKSLVVAKTESVKYSLEERKVEHVRTIPVGLDITQIKKDNRDKKIICRELGFPENKQILLFVGRLEGYKRPFAALELLKKLGDVYYLVIIGNGSLKEELKDKIRKENMKSRISYYEKIPNNLMYKYYKACDYYINFNTHEIFGMSILEAMYQGCTVVARRAPGPEEIIDDGISGFVCSTDEEMLQRILADKNADIGKQAEKRVLSSFIWEKSAEKFIKLLEKK